MLFSSLAYLVFLPVVALFYFLLPKPVKNPMLLAASYYFYMNWNAVFALLLLAATAVTYIGGRLIGQAKTGRGKRGILAACLVLLLGVLYFFKYWNFTMEGIRTLADALFAMKLADGRLNILLPVGISFFTFQVVGYLVDVYRGKTAPERNFITYALFVAFFPQLLSGPIARSTQLLPQFRETNRFDFDRMRSGLLLMGWGFFKKLVIADRLCVVANTVFSDVRKYDGVELLVAMVCFSFQIYCDFSAYTDIARGSARILGFSLMQNFQSPYLSRSIREFWQRWHISLSSWFRDYLYIPLGGSRKGMARKYVNLLVVFLVSGLWHGAAMSFVVWGLLNGLYQMIGEITLPAREKVLRMAGIDRQSSFHRGTQVLVTFLLATTAWVFFRAATLPDALYVAAHMWVPDLWKWTDGSLLKLGLDLPELALGLVSAVGVIAVEGVVQRRKNLVAVLVAQPLVYRWAAYLCLLISVLILGRYGMFAAQSFLYFQF